MFKRIVKYTGVFMVILLMLPVVLVRSGVIKFAKLFLKDDQNSRNRSADKFADFLSDKSKAHADAPAGPPRDVTGCGASCGCSAA